VPHNQIIIREKFAELMGNATEGSVYVLSCRAETLNTLIDNSDINTANACHEKLHEIQDWLVGDEVYEKESPGETIERFTEEADEIISA